MTTQTWHPSWNTAPTGVQASMIPWHNTMAATAAPRVIPSPTCVERVHGLTASFCQSIQSGLAVPRRRRCTMLHL
jgi:hypothetical protein